jgi:probable HAF family extracellular repeat protein
MIVSLRHLLGWMVSAFSSRQETWDVGTLGGSIAFPNGLNDHGQIVGTSLLSGNSIQHPFLWTKSDGIQDLGTLGGDFGEAYAINDNEEISGVASNNGTFLAVLWRHGMITNLGTLAGDCASSGYDINSNGQIVGASLACSSAFVSHPFVWEDGQMTRLHILVPPGSKLVSAEPNSINDRGEIAGFSVLDNGALRYCLSTDREIVIIKLASML